MGSFSPLGIGGIPLPGASDGQAQLLQQILQQQQLLQQQSQQGDQAHGSVSSAQNTYNSVLGKNPGAPAPVQQGGGATVNPNLAPLAPAAPAPEMGGGTAGGAASGAQAASGGTAGDAIGGAAGASGASIGEGAGAAATGSAAAGAGADAAGATAAGAGAAGGSTAGSAGAGLMALWIVCTELMRQGRLPAEWWIHGSQVFASYSETIQRGYYVYAIPAVLHLRKHPDSPLSNLLELIFVARAEYLAALAGVAGARRRPLGWLTTYGLLPIGWVTGTFFQRTMPDWRQVYRSARA